MKKLQSLPLQTRKIILYVSMSVIGVGLVGLWGLSVFNYSWDSIDFTFVDKVKEEVGPAPEMDFEELVELPPQPSYTASVFAISEEIELSEGGEI